MAQATYKYTQYLLTVTRGSSTFHLRPLNGQENCMAINVWAIHNVCRYDPVHAMFHCV